MNTKIGFVHLPRTGGTYLESVLANMGPERFINFFGTPNNQVQNKVAIIENIAKSKDSQNKLLSIPNWSTCELFSGHFSLNIKEFLPSDYRYEFVTVLRNPVDRAISFILKVTSARNFKKYMTSEDKYGPRDDKFWENFIRYYTDNMTTGLCNHERNGFSNYMTKVFSGSDLSEDIIVDEELYQKAKTSLEKMKYIGVFEHYKDVLETFVGMFNINQGRYQAKENGEKTNPIKDFLAEINYYDMKLYEEFK